MTSVFLLTDGEVFKHAQVSIIKIGLDHIADFDPDPIDQVLADLNGYMRDRATMPLAELRRRIDHPRSRRVHGYLPSDAVLAGIALPWLAQSPWPNCPYGLLFEFGHGQSLVVWRGHLYDRSAEGDLTLCVDPETGEV